MEDWTEEEVFVIDNDNKANWAIKKIRESAAEADRLKAIITAEREDLDSKEKAVNDKFEQETGYLKTLLYQYFNTVAHKATKTQETYKLLDGSLVYKKPTIKIAMPDDEKLVAYLEQNAPMLVKTVKKAAWGEFKKNLTISDDGNVVDTTTGEVVDFIGTEESEASFDVRVG
ncbi:MAG: host-nuclease inhibitor Gam family protein [Paludibacteraceae bacterium]|nr:host-nuclease inhibitor Gam family protein [Paludibacteraceae bacterium]